MALVVETGAGLASAESYASTTDADTRLANFGYTSWAGLNTTQKEQFLRLATEFMGNTYRNRWVGYRASATQALDWPRTLAEKIDLISPYAYSTYYDNNVVPVEVKNACIDLAYKVSTGVELAPDIDPVQKKVKVGPIEVEFDPQGNVATIFRAIESKLAPLLSNGAGPMTTLVRT